MPLYDLWRKKSPPPDERPLADFPHAFLTPRALADARAFEQKRGVPIALLIQPKSTGYAHVLTPYRNLKHDGCLRIHNPDLPTYILKGHNDKYAAFLLDHTP